MRASDVADLVAGLVAPAPPPPGLLILGPMRSAAPVGSPSTVTGAAHPGRSLRMPLPTTQSTPVILRIVTPYQPYAA